MQLQLNRASSPDRRTVRPAAALLMLGLFLFGQALAVSETLHHWLHEDAANPTHVCAVTALSHSQTDVPVLSVSVPAPELCLTAVAPTHCPLPLWRAFLLLPERAPPTAG